MKNTLRRLRPPSAAQLLRALPAVALAVAFVLAAALLARPMEGDVPTSASQRIFVAVRVTDILADDAQPDDWSEGLRLGTQLLEVEVLQGEH